MGDNESRMVEAAHRLNEAPEVFKVGDLVHWKKDLKNKRFPAYNEPVVIVEVLNTPVVDPTGVFGSQYFREPLSIAIGSFQDDDGLDVWHVDGRRFTRVNP